MGTNVTNNSSYANLLSSMEKISVPEALGAEGAIIRLAQPTKEELEQLKIRFELDPLHLIDITNPIHPPHLTRLEHGVKIITLRFPVEADDGSQIVTSVSIIVDKNVCTLVWPGIRAHRFKNKDLLGLDVHECVCTIIHVLVEYLLSRVYDLREVMDAFEEECLADINNADLIKLLDMRKEMNSLARQARTNAIIIEELRRGNSSYGNSPTLADAHEHMERAHSIAEAKAEHALNIMQAAQSLLSQRLNEVMTFLAIITVILTPMGIIAGVFGMNFQQMDILTNPNGFAMSVWGMLLLGAIFAAFFKFRKWW